MVNGTALSFTGPSSINVLASGIYSIRWEMYKTGYDSAFALFAGTAMVSGSNYGAMSHDEKYSGQTMVALEAGATLTLNRIDTLYPLTIINQISGGTPVIGASVYIMKMG